MPNDLPKTLLQACRYFADPQVCNDFMRKLKWPDGVIVCPACAAKGERVGEIATRSMFQCLDCGRQFSHKVGTIFEDSKLGLDKWFVAVWCVVNSKNGISSHELARALGVTQKTAWFMTHRIRKTLEIADPPDSKFPGPAEADATYVGGAAKNMHKAKREKKITGRGAVNKTIVHGVLQRAESDGEISQVRADVIGNDSADKLLPAVRSNVRYGAEVFTDAAPAYGDLALTHIHDSVDHSLEYVRGNVHTNGMENFFSLLKRALGGTYIAVAVFHLFRYVAEQVFRFNERGTDDAGRFALAMAGVVGKRLTWRLLTAQDDAGFMNLT